MTPRKTFEGDFKKMELPWGTAEREAKERHSWRNRSNCIILNGYIKKKKNDFNIFRYLNIKKELL